MFAISSRNSVPSSAISKHPMRSTRASVNAPFTWPNSSLSAIPSASPPAFIVTSGLARRSLWACTQAATTSLPVPCSPVMSTLASDGAIALDRLADLDDGRRLADEGGRRAALQPRVRLLQPLVAPHRAAQLDLRPHRRQQPLVVPGLLDVVARAAPHRLDRAGDAAPRGHDQHRQRRVERSDPLDQVEALPGPTSCRACSSDRARRGRNPSPRGAPAPRRASWPAVTS